MFTVVASAPAAAADGRLSALEPPRDGRRRSMFPEMLNRSGTPRNGATVPSGGSHDVRSQLRPKHHGASREMNGCKQSPVGCRAAINAYAVRARWLLNLPMNPWHSAISSESTIKRVPSSRPVIRRLAEAYSAPSVPMAGRCRSSLRMKRSGRPSTAASPLKLAAASSRTALSSARSRIERYPYFPTNRRTLGKYFDRESQLRRRPQVIRALHAPPPCLT